LISVLFDICNKNGEIKEREADRACSKHEKRDTYKVLVGKPEGNRPVGRKI
jgi:hypothetical protein